jgi:hypothetical protein
MTLSTNQDRLLILNKLLDVPPKQCSVILTNDQQNHWLETKSVFMIFHQLFTDYFSGNPINLQILPKESRDFFSNEFNHFLSFYNLLQWGWNYLKEVETTLDINFHNTPGQCFAIYLESIANAQIHQCFIARIDFSPRKKADLLRVIKRVLDNKDKRKNDIPRLKEYLKCCQNQGFFEFSLLSDVVIQVLSEVDDAQTQDKLKQYEYAKLKAAEAEVRYHRKKSTLAYAWENGYILDSQKAGGTYIKGD